MTVKLVSANPDSEENRFVARSNAMVEKLIFFIVLQRRLGLWGRLFAEMPQFNRALRYKKMRGGGMRLLLAENDSMLGSLVQKSLWHAGFAVDWVVKGCDLNEAVMNHHYDFAVLDLGLSDNSGEDLLQRLLKRSPRMPSIVLTSGSTHARVTLLNLGADDVLVKPFDLDELTARIRAVIRRLPTDDADAGASIYGPLSLFPLRYAATWNGEPITLTHREYWLLELLVRRKNQILSRTQIEESLYGWRCEVESNTVEVYIHSLRRKFGSDLIHTIRGVGYQLAPLQ